MRHEFIRRTIGFLFLAGVVLNVRPAVASDTPTDIVAHGENAAADRAALAAAVALLPKRPVRIAVVDVRQNRPEVRDYLLTLDAFTVNGNAVIYVVQQSAVLKAARAGFDAVPRDAGDDPVARDGAPRRRGRAWRAESGGGAVATVRS